MEDRLQNELTTAHKQRDEAADNFQAIQQQLQDIGDFGHFVVKELLKDFAPIIFD